LHLAEFWRAIPQPGFGGAVGVFEGEGDLVAVAEGIGYEEGRDLEDELAPTG
jgi:hypothetical protein